MLFIYRKEFSLYIMFVIARFTWRINPVWYYLIGFIGGAVNFCLQKSRMPMAGLVYLTVKMCISWHEDFCFTSSRNIINLIWNRKLPESNENMHRHTPCSLSYTFLHNVSSNLFKSQNYLEDIASWLFQRCRKSMMERTWAPYVYSTYKEPIIMYAGCCGQLWV